MTEEDRVRCALDKINVSRTFLHAPKVRQLLRYLVEQTLTGDGKSLGPQVIAFDVFGHADGYDPADPTVPVHMGQLRELLEAYYGTPEGKAETLRIGFDPGRYAPEFYEHQVQRRFRLPKRVVAGAVVILIVGVLGAQSVLDAYSAAVP